MKIFSNGNNLPEMLSSVFWGKKKEKNINLCAELAQRVLIKNIDRADHEYYPDKKRVNIRAAK